MKSTIILCTAALVATIIGAAYLFHQANTPAARLRDFRTEMQASAMCRGSSDRAECERLVADTLKGN